MTIISFVFATYKHNPPSNKISNKRNYPLHKKAINVLLKFGGCLRENGPEGCCADGFFQKFESKGG